MPRVTKEEIKQLKQEGGSPVIGLLVVAGIGLIVGTALILASGSSRYNNQQVITTPDGRTVIVQNRGNDLGTEIVGTAVGTTIGTVAGNMISDAFSLQQKGGASALPTGKNKGGWIKHDGKYYHYEFAKTVDKQDIVLVRTFTLSA